MRFPCYFNLSVIRRITVNVSDNWGSLSQSGNTRHCYRMGCRLIICPDVNHMKETIMAELVPIVAAVLIIFAAVDIYRKGEHDPRKSKRKNDDDYYYDEVDYHENESDWD